MRWTDLLVMLGLLAACGQAPPPAAPASPPPPAGSAAVASGSAAADPRPQPPDPIGPGFGGKPCTSQSQCGAGETCFAPDFQPGHGMIQCRDNRDCANRGGASSICVDELCIPRCKDDASCGATMQCQPDGRCVPRPCTDPRAARCPQNHRCAASGQCERVACTADAQCDTGVCWNGRCYAHGGTCAASAMCCPP